MPMGEKHNTFFQRYNKKVNWSDLKPAPLPLPLRTDTHTDRQTERLGEKHNTFFQTFKNNDYILLKPLCVNKPFQIYIYT